MTSGLDGSTRILHISDTHLGLAPYGSAERKQDFEDAFSEALRVGISHEYDAVVHTGDLTHSQTPDETLPESSWNALQQLADADIPFYFILGNHDLTEDNKSQQWVQELHKNELGQRLASSPTRVGNMALYGIDYQSQSEWVEHSFEFDPPPAGTTPVLCLHQSIAPLAPGEDNLALDDVLSAALFEFGAVLVGHSHYTQGAVVDGTPVWYAGSTERTTRGYAPDPTAALELRIEDSIMINPIEVKSRQFETYTLVPGPDVTDAQIRATLNNCELSGLVLTLFLTGELKSFADEVEAFVTEQGVVDVRILTADTTSHAPGVYRATPEDLELWDPDSPMIAWLEEGAAVQDHPSQNNESSDRERDDYQVTDRILEEFSAELDVPIEELEDQFEKLRSYDATVNESLLTISELYTNRSNSIFELDGVGILRGHFLLHSGYKTTNDLRSASDEELQAVRYIGDYTISKIRGTLSAHGGPSSIRTATSERNEHEPEAGRPLSTETDAVTDEGEETYPSERDDDSAEQKERTCAYIFDQGAFKDQAETPNVINVEVSGSDSVWECPHVARQDSEFCIFHAPTDEKDPEETCQAFLSKISDTTESSREKQFVGARFGDLDMSDRVIDPDDNYPIVLLHTRIEEGELKLDNMELTNKLQLSHSYFDGGISAKKSKLSGGIECYDCTYDSPVNFYKARLDNRPLFAHSNFGYGVRFDRAKFPIGGSFSESTFEGYAKFKHVECAGTMNFFHTEFIKRAEFNSAEFRDRVVFCDARFEFVENRDYQPNFHGAIFEDWAIFGVTDLFPGDPAAVFVQKPKFDEAIVSGPFECHETTMIDGASFVDVEFRDDVRITNGVVAGQLDFSEASISESINIEPHDTGSTPICISLVDAEVDSGRVVQPASRDGNKRALDKSMQTSYGMVVDCLRTTLGDVHFVAHDGVTADLSRVRLLKTRFKNFDFIEYRPELETDWTLHTVEDLTELCTSVDLNPVDLELTYLRAKSGANDIGDSRSAAGFFLREMRARGDRFRKDVGRKDTLRAQLETALRKYGLNRGMDWLCRYGESPRQVIFSVGLLVLVFAGVYGLGFEYIGEAPYPKTDWPLLVQYLLLSGESFVSLIGTPAADIDDWPFRVLSAFQGFIGAFMIALFLFTLTRFVHR